MPKTDPLFTMRKGLDEICTVPDKIISVYSLEKHVWADSNSEAARKARKPELQTIYEFQINPVRPFLMDILRNMAAPYKPERRDSPIGQGYWIQSEFGSGKSHLLCLLAALALGSKDAWEIVREKENKAGRGKRESLYRFWEEGVKDKGSNGKKGIFVIVKTLVGAGGGTIGLTDKGRRLSEYILDAAKEQLELELGKNVSLYPTELLADRFISEDLDRYRTDLKKFLRDLRFFEEDEFEEIEDFIRDIQQDKTPEYKRSCGNKLWRFYTEYLKVQPHIAAETEHILKHMVETILSEGYSGILLVLDEVSLFMKNRDEDQRTDDEKTLVVLSNRLANVHNLPIWTVCSAQQAIESKMGVKNIIADDRLKLVKLLEEDKDYYDIVLSRVREIKEHGRELIRLWELFDEAVRYEEDPSGVHAGLVAIKTKKETEYRAYEACKRQIDSLTKGYLKVYRDKAIKIIQTLFLYHIAKTRQQGIIPEEIANSVLIEREEDSNPDENIQHYETLADNLKKELRQIVQSYDEDSRSLYRFDPVFTGVDPRDEFRKARDEAESNELMVKEAWEHLLALDEWPVRTRQITTDVSGGVRSIFRDVAPFIASWEDLPSAHSKDQTLEVNWHGRQVFGSIAMRDLTRLVSDNVPLSPINSDETDRDFCVYIGTKPVSKDVINKLLVQRKDPRILFWTPGELTHEERDRLLNFAAYRKLISGWQGKETEDAVAVVSWVAETLKTELGKIQKIVDNSFVRGRIDALNNTQMEFHVAGKLSSILTPLVDRVLTASYESRDIKFAPPFLFRKEEAVKVINGIVKTGLIPKGAKPNQNISAAQNFGFGLKIIKKRAEKQLDVSDNPHVREICTFIDDKLTDKAQPMKAGTLYKNFMGIGGPKDYGLTRRMVQIYLLCLTREGKIRIAVGPKSGLSSSWIDYSNISDIDFSAKILDSLIEIQKMAKPENWEILRPYVEKLLGEEIPSTHDDSLISEYRSKLRNLFVEEKDASARLGIRAKSLFETLKVLNPYETELNQVLKMFSVDLESGNDIDLLLFGLKDVFGYQAFDTGTVSQIEVDDLANRLKNYRDIQNLISFENELMTAHVYCNRRMPEHKYLKEVRKAQRKVADKLTDLQTYIDSNVKLKTELIGKIPPEAGETGTLGRLIQEYTTVYVTLHDSVVDNADKKRGEIKSILEGEEMEVLRILEKISALQPAVSDDIENKLTGLAEGIFTCPSPSRRSVEEQAKRGPVHECGLAFQNSADHMNGAEEAWNEAVTIFDAAFNSKMEVFLSPTVRERLKQGESEPLIAELLNCSTVSEARSFFVKACLDDPSIVDIINRYLKRIAVKRVKMSEFKPTVSTVEKDQIPLLSQEFQKYLDDQINSIDADEDTLPMLQVE